LQRAGKGDEAIAAYKEFLRQAAAAKLAPRVVWPAYQNLALLYQARNDLAAAVDAYQKVLKADPHNAPATTQLALIYMQQHRFAQAQQAADQVLKLTPRPAAAASAHFVLGVIALTHSDFPTAENEFRQTARLSPNNAQNFFNLGYALGHQKKYPAALDALNKAIALAPKMLQPRLYSADVRQAMGDIRSAIAAYDGILKVEPHHPQALLNRAILLQQMGRAQEAISAYLQALEVQPDSFAAHLNVATLYVDIHNFAAAKQHYAAALKLAPKDARALVGIAYSTLQSAVSLPPGSARDAEFKTAETFYKQALAQSPSDLPAQNGLGLLYERAGRFADALAIYRKRLAASPDDLLAYYQVARVYTSQQQTDSILALWRQYRERHPDAPVSYNEAAQLLEAQAKVAQAITERQQLLDRKPSPDVAASTMVAIGKDLTLLKRPEEAHAQYQAVLALDATGKSLPPKQQNMARSALAAARLDALRGLADLAQNAGKTEEAVAWWNKFKVEDEALAARSDRPLNKEAYLAIGHVYETAKKYDLAAAEYRALTRVVPRDPTPYMSLGRLEDMQKHLDAAVAAYREAARRSPDPIPIRLQITELYQRYGKLDQALAEYDALGTEYPQDTRLFEPMGRIYEQAGKDSKALAAYDALLKADPHATWVNKRRAIVLTRLKRYGEARALYVQMLDRNPEDPQTYADLAEVYRQEGTPDAYLAWLQPRFEKQPASRTLMDAVLAEYTRQKREEAGWDDLRAVVARSKPGRPTQEAYASLLTEHGKRDEAVQVYRQIATQDPNNANTQIEVLNQLESLGDPVAATQFNEVLVARTDLPAMAHAYLRRRLAERYVQTGKMAEAIAQYRQVIKEDPKDFAAVSALASLLTTTGHESEVLPFTQEATYPPQLRAQILVLLGGSYEKRGDKTDAIGQYREALKLNPENLEASAGLKRLGG
jgi:tetratricopeptide (TPR) repeat protein